MREIIHYAFITDQEVIITLTDGKVITDTIYDYDEFGITPSHYRPIEWRFISNVTFS